MSITTLKFYGKLVGAFGKNKLFFIYHVGMYCGIYLIHLQ